MSEFHSNRFIKSTRKGQTCEQCGKLIDAGSQAHYSAGKWDGYMYAAYTHTECHAAARAYAELNDLWGEEWPWFRDMEDSDHDHHGWLLDNHPIVADRLGLKREPVEVE